jgi:hypothetical protein
MVASPWKINWTTVTQPTTVSLQPFVDFGNQLRIGFVVDADHLRLAAPAARPFD